MLGKLMKYEFRATAIYFLPIYAMLILVSGLRYAVSLITEKFSGSYPVFSTFGLSAAYFLLALSSDFTRTCWARRAILCSPCRLA